MKKQNKKQKKKKKKERLFMNILIHPFQDHIILQTSTLVRTPLKMLHTNKLHNI